LAQGQDGFMKHVSKVVFFLLCIAGFYWTNFNFKNYLISVPLAKAQLIFFIPVVVSVLFLLRPLLFIPMKVGLGIIFVGTIITGFTFSPYTLKRDIIYFAPYIGDFNASQTRIDRILFEENLSKTQNTVSVSSVYDTVDTTEEAVGLIDNREFVRGVIWGNTRTLNITFGDTISFMQVPERDWSTGFENMKIITTPSEVDVPYSPRKETIELIAASFSQDPMVLEEAAKVVVLWKSNTLRSFVLFKLGTLHLVSFFNANAYSAESLNSAISSFQTAYKFAPGLENRLLRRVILSNLAVALTAKGKFESNPQLLKSARGMILDAARITIEQDKFDRPFVDSRLIQRQNSDALRLLLKD
jgi:hypothetical protein